MSKVLLALGIVVGVFIYAWFWGPERDERGNFTERAYATGIGLMFLLGVASYLLTF